MHDPKLAACLCAALTACTYEVAPNLTECTIVVQPVITIPDGGIPIDWPSADLDDPQEQYPCGVATVEIDGEPVLLPVECTSQPYRGMPGDGLVWTWIGAGEEYLGEVETPQPR